MKLNLGCGQLPLEGFKNIDISPEAKADEFYDLDKGIKEKDETIEEIHAGCSLEQVKELKFVLNECWRVLVTGGILYGYVPSTDSRVLHLDPEDRYFFQLGTFDYFNVRKNAWQEFGRTYGYRGWNQVEATLHDNGIIHFKMTK